MENFHRSAQGPKEGSRGSLFLPLTVPSIPALIGGAYLDGPKVPDAYVTAFAERLIYASLEGGMFITTYDTFYEDVVEYLKAVVIAQYQVSVAHYISNSRHSSVQKAAYELGYSRSIVEAQAYDLSLLPCLAAACQLLCRMFPPIVLADGSIRLPLQSSAQDVGDSIAAAAEQLESSTQLSAFLNSTMRKGGVIPLVDVGYEHAAALVSGFDGISYSLPGASDLYSHGFPTEWADSVDLDIVSVLGFLYERLQLSEEAVAHNLTHSAYQEAVPAQGNNRSPKRETGAHRLGNLPSFNPTGRGPSSSMGSMPSSDTQSEAEQPSRKHHSKQKQKGGKDE